MCGIAGIVNFQGTSVEPGAIERLTRLLAHRGPDGEGIWFNANRSVALGHRRLAIIDPGIGGSQPMVSTDGRYVIVYNGEIYNFLELRRELEAKGIHCRTDSDTEVILGAWQAWGPDMLLRFNGMWTCAIFDQVSEELFIARDRFGIKPLFFASTADHFVFASEQRALQQSGLITTTLDTEATRRALIDPFGLEGSERTLLREVNRLPAGRFLWLRSGQVKIHRWWNTLEHLPEIPKKEDERAEQFGELFREAVALRMRSDVPIGTCLSGGFDSSAIICAMADHERAGMGPRENTGWRHAFVATFPDSSNDERPQAEEAAKWAGVDPKFLPIGRNDALANLEQILDGTEDLYIGLPNAIWFIYRELRRDGVLVSLDGHGADELMGAYLQAGRSSAFWLRNALSGLASRSRPLAHAIEWLRLLRIKQQGFYFLNGGISAAPRPLPLVTANDELPPHWGALNRRLYQMFHDTVLPTILRNFDRVSMSHGIEVRMPFMDWRLVTYVMALPDESKAIGGYSKVVARRAMAGRMPESIRTNRSKVGFNSPMPEWLNGPLAKWVGELLAQPIPAFSELVDEVFLKATVERLCTTKTWSWESAGRIWPYLHLKWLLTHGCLKGVC